ncbi:hypothetical protein GCM10025789_19270 [Tessaracoccus lubricantis]|uniref:NodB homology domain-containing protein n=1 Tax=Tessaracoccus lubricantis TaxID=545543 RepID=A0ABP9FG77_9ACTN
MRHIKQWFMAALTLSLVAAGWVAAPPAHAVDVYTTPGEHISAGREWRTWCEPYSQTARCTSQLKVAGVWTFNNLTYLPSPRSLWVGNPLATPGQHQINGRLWRTECETAATGRNGCRAYIWDGTKFVFNNIVQFGALRSDLATLYWYRPPADQAPSVPAPSYYNINRGPNPTDRVTLTFDDCPVSLSAFKTTVNAATDLGIALVLFPTGNCITAGRFDAAYARSKGHYVFNHSISHPDLTSLPYSEVVRELGAPGVVTTYGRPPGGQYDTDTVKRAYAAVGMRIWLWNLDTFDYRGRTSQELITRVVTYARPGDSVLMHMKWNAFNGPTLKAMRDGLKARGIGVCVNRGPVSAKPAGLSC